MASVALLATRIISTEGNCRCAPDFAWHQQTVQSPVGADVKHYLCCGQHQKPHLWEKNLKCIHIRKKCWSLQSQINVVSLMVSPPAAIRVTAHHSALTIIVFQIGFLSLDWRVNWGASSPARARLRRGEIMDIRRRVRGIYCLGGDWIRFAGLSVF